MKKVLLFLLVLMFFPTTTFAITSRKDFGKIESKKSLQTCNQYINYYFDYPIVGENPSETVKAVYKTSENEGTINIRVDWYEYDSSAYDALMLDYSIDGTKLEGKFKKGKYYIWDFAEDLTAEERVELNSINREFTCNPSTIINDVSHNNSSELDWDIFNFVTPIEKNDTIEITDASVIDYMDDYDKLYDSIEDFMYGTIDGLNVSFNLKFDRVDTSYTYLITIKNGYNEDVEIHVGELANKSDYVEYDFRFADSNNIAKAYSNKYLYVTATYKIEVPEEQLENGYTESNEIELKVGTDPLPDDKENNPKTNTSTAIIIVALSVALIIAIIRIGVKKKIKYFVIVLASLFIFVPFTVDAVKSATLKVVTNVEITYEMTSIKIDDETIYIRSGMTLDEFIHSDYNVNHYVECISCSEVTSELVGKQALCPIYVSINKGKNDPIMDEGNFEVVTLDYCQEVK